MFKFIASCAYVYSTIKKRQFTRFFKSDFSLLYVPSNIKYIKSQKNK